MTGVILELDTLVRAHPRQMVVALSDGLATSADTDFIKRKAISTTLSIRRNRYPITCPTRFAKVRYNLGFDRAHGLQSRNSAPLP